MIPQGTEELSPVTPFFPATEPGPLHSHDERQDLSEGIPLLWPFCAVPSPSADTCLTGARHRGLGVPGVVAVLCYPGERHSSYVRVEVAGLPGKQLGV